VVPHQAADRVALTGRLESTCPSVVPTRTAGSARRERDARREAHAAGTNSNSWCKTPARAAAPADSLRNERRRLRRVRQPRAGGSSKQLVADLDTEDEGVDAMV